MTLINAADIDVVGRSLRHALVAALIEANALHSPRWISAFGAVPRHVFVPRFLIDREGAGSYELIDRSDARTRREWLERVYSDESLPIQLEGVEWVSSSSQPSLMARMLESLNITGRERVLEVGTGSGYNAALLCEALDNDKVVSIDIDPDLVAAAKERLKRLGYRPTLAIGDGAGGYPESAPYDRIIATCSMEKIPHSWICQTLDRGLILANLYRSLGGGALALLRIHNEQASGNFLPFAGGFMPTRTRCSVSGVDLLERRSEDDTFERPVRIGPEVLRDDGFGMFAALRISAQRLILVPDEGPEQFWLLGEDGSWAFVASNDHKRVAVQGGPVRLWDALESAYAKWVSLGRPPRQEFGLTVTASGEHLVWHGAPDGRTWTL